MSRRQPRNTRYGKYPHACLLSFLVLVRCSGPPGVNRAATTWPAASAGCLRERCINPASRRKCPPLSHLCVSAPAPRCVASTCIKRCPAVVGTLASSINAAPAGNVPAVAVTLRSCLPLDLNAWISDLWQGLGWYARAGGNSRSSCNSFESACLCHEVPERLLGGGGGGADRTRATTVL